MVDNASEEDCRGVVLENFPDVRLIANRENVGFARAANQGAKVAESDYLLILNPDTIIPEDSLTKALEYARNHPGTGAVGCRFIDGSGALLPECKRNFPGISAAMAKLLGFGRGYYAAHLDEHETGRVEVLTGAFMFLRRELFEQMKGFDENFFMFGEDIDLSYRIQKSGFINQYLGSITIIHFKGESSVKDVHYLKHFYGALEIFYRKHFKHNALGRALLRLLVRTATGLWGRREKPVDFQRRLSTSAVYLGGRPSVFQALKKNHGNSSVQEARNLDQALSSYRELLFLDSGSLSYKKIIEAIDGMPEKMSGRVVSKKGDFYLGSDSSRSRGESVRLQP